MLVIRRRAGQSIVIGEEVEVHVTEVGGGRVKLAISAPKHIAVQRKEVKLTREANVTAARELCLERLLDFAARFSGHSAHGKKLETPPAADPENGGA